MRGGRWGCPSCQGGGRRRQLARVPHAAYCTHGCRGEGRKRHARTEPRVTASGTRFSAVADARPPGCPRPLALTAVIFTATLVAVGLRLYDLSRPGFLLGINEYDEGTD